MSVAEPSTQTKPPLDALADLCIRFVCRDTSWVMRRKESVVVISESIVRRQMSVDFELPLTVEPHGENRGQSVCWVPLLLLRKAPAALTGFDFRDEAGRSLPLPLRIDNADVSAATLEQLATSVLVSSPQDGGGGLSPGLLQQLREVALEPDGDTAEALLRKISEPPDPDPDRQHKRILWANDDFRWLAESLAASSIVVVPFIGAAGSRRVVKLSYDEVLATARRDWTVGRLRRLRRLRQRVLESVGWRGYILYVASPFIGARTYHFELSAPDGMIITDGLLVDSEDDEVYYQDGPRLSVHFYVRHAEAKRQALSVFQFRIRAGGFVAGAWVTASIIAIALTACWHWADRLSGTSNGAPSALLLFPGIVAAYVGRVGDHPLTSRLLANARRLLFAAGVLAYIGAGRLALISTDHPASATSLRHLFARLALAAWVVLASLFATRQLPLSLGSKVRRRLGSGLKFDGE
jgi:hypothetical protein